jgi:hypothetical protein
MLTYARTEIVSESAGCTPPIEFLAGAWLVSYSSNNTRTVGGDALRRRS